MTTTHGRILQSLQEEEDQLLLDLAVVRGRLTSAQVEILSSLDAPLDRAVTLGLLTPDQVEELRKGAQRRDLDLLNAGRPEPVPEEVQRARLDPARLLDRYTLVEPLGQGGAGTVWRSWDGDLQRWVALKIPRAPISASLRARFLREARIAAGLRHPNLVAVHDVGEFRSQPYLVMELIQGRPMDPAAGPRRCAELLRTVALALETAHRQGIVHRDLKPANILVDDRSVPHVVDFGLAHVEESGPAMTRTGAAVGTPRYMAPEQIRGGREITPRTDVYALGVILYQALAGDLPFRVDSENELELFERILTADPVPPRRIDPSLPVDLEAICLKAIEKDPRRRYASAADLAEDLGLHLSGLPVRARPSTALTRGWRRVRRHPWRLGTATFAAVAIVIMTIGWWTQVRGMSRKIDVQKQVGDVSSAYYELALKTAEPMRRLEDCWYRGDALGAQEALPFIEAVTRSVSSRHPEVRLPGAWRGLALFYAGQEAEGLREIEAACSAGGVDPFPHVLRARVVLDRYVRDLRAPIRLSLEQDGRVAVRHEVPGARSTYREAAATLERAQALGVWKMLDHGREIEQYAEGVLYLTRGDPASAAVRFESLRDDPMLKDQAGMFEGLAQQLVGRQDLAASAWDRVAGRGWPAASYCAGMAWLQLAIDSGDVDPGRAIDRFGAAIDRDRSLLLSCRGELAMAWLYKSRFESARGRDPALARDQALSLVDEVEKDARGHLFRGCLKYMIGQDERRRGRDPRLWYSRATADLEASLALDPDQPAALTHLKRLKSSLEW